MRHILVCNPDGLGRFQLCFARRSTYDLEKVTNHDASVLSLNGDCNYSTSSAHLVLKSYYSMLVTQRNVQTRRSQASSLESFFKEKKKDLY